jgi:hypothetical protein
MTPIYILFARMLDKMFHISIKYTQLLHVSTTQGNFSVTFFFQGIYRTAHSVTRTLKYSVVFLFLVLHGVPCIILRLLYAPVGYPPLGRLCPVLLLCGPHSFIRFLLTI